MDLVVTRGDGRVLAIEVKLSQTVTDADVRHLRWLRDRLGDRLLDAVVITTGTDAYRRRDGVAVVPAALRSGHRRRRGEGGAVGRLVPCLDSDDTPALPTAAGSRPSVVRP